MLLSLLRREGYWIKWKADGCQSFERAPAEAPAPAPAPAPAAAPARLSKSSHKDAPISYAFGKSFDEALVGARALVAAVPSFTQVRPLTVGLYATFAVKLHTPAFRCFSTLCNAPPSPSTSRPT